MRKTPDSGRIRTLQEFAERYSTPDAIPADNAARKLMSLADEDRVVYKRQSDVVDKGERVSWLLCRYRDAALSACYS